MRAAGAQKVPAYVVFTDATLMALAERRPADAGELSPSPASAPASSACTATPCSPWSAARPSMI